MINPQRFSEIGLHFGCLAEVIALDQGNEMRDFPEQYYASGNALPRTSRGHYSTRIFDEKGNETNLGQDADDERSYVFVLRESTGAMTTKYPSLQVRFEGIS